MYIALQSYQLCFAFAGFPFLLQLVLFTFSWGLIYTRLIMKIEKKKNHRSKQDVVTYQRNVSNLYEFTFDPYFRGSNALPIFAANLLSGLVRVFNCFIAFSLCEWGNWEMGKCSFKSRSDDKLRNWKFIRRGLYTKISARNYYRNA